MDLKRHKILVKQKAKENKAFFQQVKRLKPKVLDKQIHQLHEEVFACTDCLKCANCCKTTGPLFTNKDIERISGKLKLTQQQFIVQYLRIDEDNDYVLQQTPCTFLGEDNYCSIYDFRPKACREYPHTDRKKQYPLLTLNLKNTEVCPAVYQIFEELKKEMNP